MSTSLLVQGHEFFAALSTTQLFLVGLVSRQVGELLFGGILSTDIDKVVTKVIVAQLADLRLPKLQLAVGNLSIYSNEWAA